jgi:site-specific recombinase XerD
MNSADRPLVSVYREALIARHYAHRTIDTYESWLRRFLRFYLLRHPREMGGPEINAFLTHLAVEERVSASTQNQALAALLFLWVKDLDFAGKQLIIRGGKGNKDHVTVLPQNQMEPLQIHLQEVRRLHRLDLAVAVPTGDALAQSRHS